MKNLLTILILAIILVPTMAAAQETLGTFKLDDCVTLIQTCPSCSYVNFTSVLYPNSTAAITGLTGAQSGTEYTASFCNTSVGGEYIVNGVADVDGIDTVFAYDFDITQTGKPTPEGLGTLLTGIFIVVFGVACVFLWLSTQTVDLGPKLFFFVASLVFLTGSIGLAMVVAFDSNVSSAINNTMLAIMFSLGMILFVIIAYILIKQWFTILEIMRLKKGHSLGAIPQQTYSGYNNQRTWS